MGELFLWGCGTKADEEIHMLRAEAEVFCKPEVEIEYSTELFEGKQVFVAMFLKRITVEVTVMRCQIHNQSH